MKWTHSRTPTGVSVYTSGRWRIEADMKLSTHVGFVFGQFVNDADRYPRIVGWLLYRDGRTVVRYRKLADAKARAERDESGER